MYPHERSLVKRMEGRPFVLLGVNSDATRDTLKRAQDDNQLTWRSWWDGKGGPIAEDWRVTAWPTLVLIDHRGIIRARGFAPSELNKYVDQLVREAEADRKAGTS